MNIIKFLQDKDIGGQVIKDLSTWNAWLTFLKAVFALPMTDDERDLFTRCTARERPPMNWVEMVVAIIGRRGGKSFVSALLAVFLATSRDWRQHLAPGEKGHVVVIAQSLKAARTVFGYIRGIFRAIPALERMILAERADELELSNGIIISCWPCTYRSTRGLTIVVAICDEVDFWFQEGPHMAEEVIASIKPAMLTVPDAMLILISSPYTPLGVFFKLFEAHWGKDEDDVLIWKAPSLVMNPTLNEARIARAIAEDPDRGRAEWEAEWRSGVAVFLDAVLVDQGIRRDPLILPPREGVRYKGAADPCGSGVEEFTWGVDHREDDRVVVDLVNGRRKRGRQNFNLEEAVRDCCTDMRAYGVTEILGDRYSANWVKEAFAREGLLYRHAEKPKSECYREMLPLFVMGKIEIPNDTDLVRQLKLLERRTGSQGRDIIDHPSGARDDRANVLALAVAALPPVINPEGQMPWAGGRRLAALGSENAINELVSWTEKGSRGVPDRWGDW